MKKCDCKIMNTLSRYPKVWPWLGVAGYALDGAELVLKHTRWGKMNYKARMLVHGAGAGLLCLGAGVHTAQAVAAGMVNVPAAVTGAVIGTGIVGLNYTHAEAKKIGVKRARVLHRVFCAMTGLGIAAHVIGVKRRDTERRRVGRLLERQRTRASTFDSLTATGISPWLLLCCAHLCGNMRPDRMQNRNSEVRRNEERQTLRDRVSGRRFHGRKNDLCG